MDLSNNPMIKKVLDKAPDHLKEMIQSVIDDDKLSIHEKITKLNDKIKDDPNYDKANKMKGMFSKFLGK